MGRLTSGQLLGHWIDQAHGFLSLESYMARALYDSEYGYYTCNIKGVGAEGDFSTSATLSKLLGRGIAQWALDRGARMSGGFRWNLVEAGGGSGVLAAAVLENLPMMRRLGCRFHMIEISPQLRKLQKRRLRPFSVQWFNRLEEVLRNGSGEAMIYSNELLDAFPCMQFAYRERQWQVVGLRRDVRDGVVEGVRVPETEDEKEALFFLNPSVEMEQEGRRIEIQWSIRHWIRQWSESVNAGRFLVVDYGEESSVLQKRHPYGSLRAYFQHQPLEGEECYRRVGRQDLTVDVNFTHLRRWMEEAGWEMTRFQEQRDFLLEHVRRNWSDCLPEEQQLMNEFGAGGAFKVICFEK